MGNRASRERAAIEQSAVHTEEPKRRRRSTRSTMASLYATWGGDDCIFYFRWAEAEMGFRTAGIQAQAEFVGKRPKAFWDDVAWLRSRAKSNPAAAAMLKRLEATMGGAAARPTQSRQGKVITQPDRTTDEQLVATRRYRRVAAGMARLRAERPVHYLVLGMVFLPRRSLPKIERELKQYVHLALWEGPIVDAHRASTAKEDEPLALEDWLERRIDRHDARRHEAGEDELIARARAQAEQTALEAIRAFEAVCEAPAHILEAEREKKEPKEPRTRPPVERQSVKAAFNPPGWRP
jgi:hypothetical protein